MSKEPLIIIDADAIIALNNRADAHHEKAKKILKWLTASEASTLFPTTAICEAVTVLRGRLNKPEDAEQVINKLHAGDFPLQEVGHNELGEAAKLFRPQGSKKHTLFDAVIAAIARQTHADAIFSFDAWYEKQGLLLASDLFPTEPSQEEPEERQEAA